MGGWLGGEKQNSNSRMVPFPSFNGLHGDGPFMVCCGKCVTGRIVTQIRWYWKCILLTFDVLGMPRCFLLNRIATLCEIISYADLSGILPFTSDRILAENIAYVLLNITGRTFELLAFCTVTEIWLRTAIDARPRSMHSETASHNFWFHCLIYVFVFFTVLLVLASVLLSVVIFCRYPHAPNREYVLTMPLSMLQTLLEAIFWGMHVLMVTISITMTSKCILVLVPPTESRRRYYLLAKAVGPMTVSCLAYATRCGWLIAAYLQQGRRDCWAWWISFAWIPTASVSVVLLYSIRKRDHAVEEMSAMEDSDGGNNVLGNTNDELRESLLRPQPPEGMVTIHKTDVESESVFLTMQHSHMIVSC